LSVLGLSKSDRDVGSTPGAARSIKISLEATSWTNKSVSGGFYNKEEIGDQNFVLIDPS
jgi:hypothetical protein